MVSRVDRSPMANWWWTVDRWFLAAFLSLMAWRRVVVCGEPPPLPNGSASTASIS